MYNYRKVTDDLYWVGANDHRLALFENIHPLCNHLIRRIHYRSSYVITNIIQF